MTLFEPGIFAGILLSCSLLLGFADHFLVRLGRHLVHALQYVVAALGYLFF